MQVSKPLLYEGFTKPNEPKTKIKQDIEFKSSYKSS